MPIYFSIITGQTFVMLISLFWVNTMFRESERANRAEEINRLTKALAKHEQHIIEEKRQLEQSIQLIIDVHTQVANGNLNARVPLDSGNVLWGIAGSLNTLLARLQNLQRNAQSQQLTEQAIKQLILDIRQAKARRIPLPSRRTGTPLDPLIAELTGEASS